MLFIVIIKHNPTVAKAYIKKYLFEHIKTTSVQQRGNKNTNKNNKKGTKVVNKTKITLIAAIMAMKVMH